MKHRWFVIPLLALVIALASVANAQPQGLIVRDSLGPVHLNSLCHLLGCKMVRGLGDPSQQVFLVVPTLTTLANLLQLLQLQIGILNAEVDQLLNLNAPLLSFIPNGLFDGVPVPYYNTTVWDSYVNQPANLIVRTVETQNQFHISGSGIVAVIDTGLDPQHPALAPIVLTGYDFTRNQSGADEKGDLDHSTAAVLDGGGSGIPLYISPWLAAVLTPAGAAALGDPRYAAFGHGTMTAGIVHMVAPTAQILPLKAFSSDGTGYLSNILRAVYYASRHGSKVISMSFSFHSSSAEMTKAIMFANRRGVICVAAAGNDGQKINVYPASLGNVMGVASTTDMDTRSSFSNYGPQVVWVAAPGENVVSTYPYGTYASSSGTSFSAPIVSGTAELLVNVDPGLNQSAAAAAIAHAQHVSPGLNHGRLDIYQAVSSLSH